MLLKTLPLLLLSLPYSLAINHDIQVGPDLTFTPNTTSASPGSTITFHFYSGRHNVAQSVFTTPCVPSPNGFYSGFIVPSTDAESPTTFVITINDTKPIWFYCSEYMHCQLGMVGVVNPPASGDTLAAYALAASNSTNSTTPTNVGGGVFSSAEPNPAPTSTSTLPLSGTGSGRSTSSTPTQSTSAGAVFGGGNVFLNGITAAIALAAVWAGLI